ncbi:hypothetical protein LZV00_01905 [Pseudomonas kielensis]|uniref:hypothetical protein n=1 Tax=Pseudomonas kielensis TaxID=2762577 RepID=UPI00223F7C96|nr:hypothetical protein [Pseudomonas kielensis]UZM14597.1 hypothetical protein LZV00_01905 [Pseudomonas kielensis]
MKYIITGRVQPERAEVSFSHVELNTPKGGTVAISCTASQLTVVLNEPSTEDYGTAIFEANIAASMVVGAVGFSLGSAYSTDLIQVISEDGAPYVFGVRPGNPENLNETLAFNDTTDVLNRSLRLAAKDAFFRLALRDYLQGINEVVDCVTYCYRAIEGIKSSFAASSGKTKDWGPMHAALGTDAASIISLFKKHGDPARHGNWGEMEDIDAETKWKMLSMTRHILKTYLDIKQPDMTW